MQKLLLLGVCAALLGCSGTTKVVSQRSSGQDRDDDPAAVALLKQAMATYSKLPAYSADCSFSLKNGGQGGPPEARTFSFQKPNMFKAVTSKAGDLTLTSVSDGKSVLEFDNKTGQQPQVQVAPESLADLNTVLTRNPMFCGTLLYQFFGGPDNYTALVDSDKGAVTFGAEEKMPTGEQAHVVKFYGRQQYGHVEALIGEKTGYVYRITYDSEPLVKMMQDPEQQKQTKANAQAALNSIQDPSQRAEAEKTLEASSNIQSLTSTETYSNISSPASLPETIFALNAPKGTTPVQMPSMPSDRPNLLVDSTAPDFKLTGLDGKQLKLSQFRGHPVFLDFWATWCGPCVAALPHTQKVFQAGKAGGLQVLAISDETSDVVSKFVKDNQYTFPTALDAKKEAADAYKVNAIPTMVVIDEGGKVVAYIVGGGQDEEINKALGKVGIRIED